VRSLNGLILKTPKYWRPPYLDIDNRVGRVAESIGLQTVMLNMDTNDMT
jgi:peptidoglycan/xylan/chitin deacetylase (PgdA/CDA1 family)